MIPAPPKITSKKPAKDSLRELVETIVFVVVLVLILKLFVVEAFVIPTGSMAETLLGYHKRVECEQCGYEFPVNSSGEVEGRRGGEKSPVVGYHCPNCNFPGKLKLIEHEENRGKYYTTELASRDGDRVLVHKAMSIDHRGSVVVFKFPSDPQLDHVAQNYIKRLVAFGGETIAIFHGKLFVHKSLAYPDEIAPENPKDLWDRPNTYNSKPNAIAAFEASKLLSFPENAGGFELIRKPDDQVLAMRRIVYHNDFQAKDLQKNPPRWKTSGEGWGATEAGQKVYTHSGEGRGFLKYEHLLVPNLPVKNPDDRFPPIKLSERRRDFAKLPEPSLIRNFMGYNSGVSGSFTDPLVGAENADNNSNWVGDLHVECQAKIGGPDDAVILDLGKALHRYQAHFTGGAVKLIRTGPGGKELASRPTPMTKAGKHALRFANVDCRLRVWVDDVAIDFGNEADYAFEAPTVFENDDVHQEGWTKINDKNEPAAIEVRGGVTISSIVLWRDTHYTNADAARPPRLETIYVQPGHFLCFGDNSAQSHDGRGWGLVPERLMLGRAVFTFWPFKRIGFIR